MVVSSQSWDEICATYRQNQQLSPMLQLAELLSSPLYKERFYGYIFIEGLVICAYSAFELFSNTLHFDYDTELNKFNCGWYTGNKREWGISIPADDMMSSADQIIKKVTWY